MSETTLADVLYHGEQPTEFTRQEMTYHVSRADGRPLTKADIFDLEDNLSDVLIGWMEGHGFNMNGGTRPAKDEEERAPEAKRFALLEFNEDHLVVSFPDGKVLGRLDDTYGEDPIWYEDPQQHLKLLFGALGWTPAVLSGWQQNLIGAAMRQQRDCLDYANHGSPVSIGSGELLRLALEQTPDLFTTQPLVTTEGCLLDGDLGKAAINRQVCAWAYMHGWSPVDGDNSDAAAARLVEDAQMYLSENVLPYGLVLEWSGSSLIVARLEDNGVPF